MSEGAAHLVDNVIPDVPIRQWVLSFPYNLRYLFAYQKKALHQGLQVVIRVINRYYINKGEERYGFKGKTGAISLIQRFGGHLNLNPHFHFIFLDGIFNEDGKFFRISPPTNEELGEVVLKIKDRVFKSLEKKEWIDGYNLNFETDELYEESPLLSEIMLASIQNRLYLGQEKGDKALKGSGTFVEVKGKQCVYKDGFSLHAGVMIAGHNTKAKERLIRYVLRPSVSNERLKKREDGDLEYQLKRKWSDGTKSVKLSGEELIVRLISLIPPPRMNLIRYSGVLGPNSSLRKKVVKKTESKIKEKKGRSYIEWSKLLKRVFQIDVTKCKCGGELKIISAILDRNIIRPILDHLNISTEIPIPTEARSPPEEQLTLW